ncbi:MAG: hypothetical protein HC800_04160 [Phormidesmis sp. RL_2_1]|nr:hypothetical protein [Phormidesmis sp. RL_2_1]
MKHLMPLCLPPIILLSINLLQLVALPEAVLPTHATGSVRFTTWFLLYFAIILSLNPITVEQIKKSIGWMLLVIFAVGILRYPSIVLQAGGSLGSALSNYGQLGERLQLSGIFGSANEDANGFVTILPLVLLWIEQQKGIKRGLLRWTLLIYFPLVLVLTAPEPLY